MPVPPGRRFTHLNSMLRPGTLHRRRRHDV